MPTRYDLRKLGLVSPVQDQKTCGSCWAFSSVANLESLALQAGKNTGLSEQAVLDCSEGTYDGWYLDKAFDFLMEQGTAQRAILPSCVVFVADCDGSFNNLAI